MSFELGLCSDADANAIAFYTKYGFIALDPTLAAHTPMMRQHARMVLPPTEN